MIAGVRAAEERWGGLDVVVANAQTWVWVDPDQQLHVRAHALEQRRQRQAVDAAERMVRDDDERPGGNLLKLCIGEVDADIERGQSALRE